MKNRKARISMMEVLGNRLDTYRKEGEQLMTSDCGQAGYIANNFAYHCIDKTYPRNEDKCTISIKGKDL